MATVTLTIDGRQVTVEKGRTVLQAAIEHGIRLPYYCYHPGLAVDGSCRVCIVKIEKMPKLQTSCSTVSTDGMVVSTQAPEVVEARAGVLEFLLINHPLDCPVCDKGGECPLQDFAYSFGPAQSRMEFPRRTFDGQGVKADVDFGPTLMLNRNRCILCTRCVRFMREIDGDPQISLIDRGYGTEIATFQEQGVHSLLSGNLMDVCPVGAITTKDYRFKSRPWDNPQVVDTICTRCPKGCNTSAWLKAKPEWSRGARLIRFTPRFNPAVNGYWMCDIGRFEYHWVEGDRRLRRPLMRDAAGVQQPVAWHDLLRALADRMTAAGPARPGSVRFLVSAHASLEELFILKHLASGLAGAEQNPELTNQQPRIGDRGPGTGAPGPRTRDQGPVPLVTVSWRTHEKPQPSNTRFRVPAIEAPNVAGARDLGLSVGDGLRPDIAALQSAAEEGSVSVLYVLDPGPAGSIGDLAWVADARRTGKLSLLIAEGVLMTELADAADFVLPGAASVEKEALYTNDEGHVQATARAIPPPGEAREDWQILVDVARLLGLMLDYTQASEIRADIAAALVDRPAYAEIPSLTFGRPMGARHWLQASNPSERWKWDFMFHDTPPVKGASPAPAPLVIPRTKVGG